MFASDILTKVQFYDLIVPTWWPIGRLDSSWCHYSKNNMTGQQITPSRKLGYDQSISIDPKNISSIYPYMNRSCVVLYQTPIMHGDARSLKKTHEFRQMNNQVYYYLAAHWQLIMEGDAVYEVFTTKLHDNNER